MYTSGGLDKGEDKIASPTQAQGRKLNDISAARVSSHFPEVFSKSSAQPGLLGACAERVMPAFPGASPDIYQAHNK